MNYDYAIQIFELIKSNADYFDKSLPAELYYKPKQGMSDTLVKKHLGLRFVEDLGIDSLGSLEFACAVEEAFDIEIPEDKLYSIKTIEDAVKYIESVKPASSD